MFVGGSRGDVGRVLNVSTAALKESAYPQIKKRCEQTGVAVSDDEFHCRGSFKLMHKGKPDDADIQAAKAFAGKITG